MVRIAGFHPADPGSSPGVGIRSYSSAGQSVRLLTERSQVRTLLEPYLRIHAAILTINMSGAPPVKVA